MTERIRTHWADCWRDRTHHECALARIERLEADNAALRQALQGIAEDTNTDDDTADYLRHLAKLALKDAALLAGKKP